MKNYRKADQPCEGCESWKNNTEKFECKNECDLWKTYIKTEKSCWTCAFGIIGYGCVYNPENPVDIGVDGVCDVWIGNDGRLICCCGMGSALRDNSIEYKNEKLYINNQDVKFCPFCGEII